jgi:hypothetical protein
VTLRRAAANPKPARSPEQTLWDTADKMRGNLDAAVYSTSPSGNEVRGRLVVVQAPPLLDLTKDAGRGRGARQDADLSEVGRVDAGAVERPAEAGAASLCPAA